MPHIHTLSWRNHCVRSLIHPCCCRHELPCPLYFDTVSVFILPSLPNRFTTHPERVHERRASDAATYSRRQPEQTRALRFPFRTLKGGKSLRVGMPLFYIILMQPQGIPNPHLLFVLRGFTAKCTSALNLSLLLHTEYERRKLQQQHQRYL